MYQYPLFQFLVNSWILRGTSLDIPLWSWAWRASPGHRQESPPGCSWWSHWSLPRRSCGCSRGHLGTGHSRCSLTDILESASPSCIMFNDSQNIWAVMVSEKCKCKKKYWLRKNNNSLISHVLSSWVENVFQGIFVELLVDLFELLDCVWWWVSGLLHLNVITIIIDIRVIDTNIRLPEHRTLESVLVYTLLKRN